MGARNDESDDNGGRPSHGKRTPAKMAVLEADGQGRITEAGRFPGGELGNLPRKR
jgi:hypothetical protein